MILQDLFLQRVPISLMHVYKSREHQVDFIVEETTYHFCFQVVNDDKKGGVLRELNQYFGPMKKDLYNFVCSNRRTYL